MRKLIIVTKKDIKQGISKKCHKCPVALALRRHLGKNYIAVQQSFVDIGDTWTQPTRYVLSRSVARFIKKFDNGEKVKPFSFRINI